MATGDDSGSPAADAPTDSPPLPASKSASRPLDPDQEEALLRQSQAIKAEANLLFSSRDYENALARYGDALASCPSRLAFDLAVLQSNMAACHLKLEQWKEAMTAATDALDELNRHNNQHSQLSSGDSGAEVKPPRAPADAPPTVEDDQVEEEVISAGASRSAPSSSQPPPRPAADSEPDVLRIKTKALLRRARARTEAGGWQNLAGAEEDYRLLADMPGLSPSDVRTVRTQLMALPPRVKAAQESETAEMWSQLRQLGDGILKPFGLSTQNFQMAKDDKTGGYSVNFTQGGGAS